jgi:hypothetical protein
VLPLITALSLGCVIWMERDVRNLGIAIVVATVVHLWLRKLSHNHLRMYSNGLVFDEDDEQGFGRLGLRA